MSDAPLPVDIKKEEPSSTAEPETNHKDEDESIFVVLTIITDRSAND